MGQRSELGVLSAEAFRAIWNKLGMLISKICMDLHHPTVRWEEPPGPRLGAWINEKKAVTTSPPHRLGSDVEVYKKP